MIDFPVKISPRRFIILLIRLLSINWLPLILATYATSTVVTIAESENGLNETKANLTNVTQFHDNIIEKCKGFQLPCDQLPALCLQCNMTHQCTYGEEIDVNCTVWPGIECEGDSIFVKSMKCAYCYQFPSSNYTCSKNFSCQSVGTNGYSRYTAECTVNQDILCLGNRTFQKNINCNWISGYRWSTALVLSVTLGGFGVDRFYLGHWRAGLGKLFSLGGLGVWTLVDVVLIAIGYLKPADGSLYL